MSDETYGSSVPNADGSHSVVDIETALRVAVESRDFFKSQMERVERDLGSAQKRAAMVHSALTCLIETITEADSDTVTVETDSLEAVYNAAQVSFEKSVELELKMTASVIVSVPVWYDPTDLDTDEFYGSVESSGAIASVESADVEVTRVTVSE
jgi:hypothetical protein